jgi:hypothetical protein
MSSTVVLVLSHAHTQLVDRATGRLATIAIAVGTAWAFGYAILQGAVAF